MPIQDKLTISCERCENKFEHVKDLQNHMRCQTQAKYLCDECDYFSLNYWTVCNAFTEEKNMTNLHVDYVTSKLQTLSP